jgi:hypothetical protein
MAVIDVLTTLQTQGNRLGDGAYKLVKLANVTATGSEIIAAPGSGRLVGALIAGVDAHTGTNYVTVTAVNNGNSDAVMASGLTTSGGVDANKGAYYYNTVLDGATPATADCTTGDIITVTSTESGTLANATAISLLFELD